MTTHDEKADDWDDWGACAVATPVELPKWRPPVLRGLLPDERVPFFTVERANLDNFYSVAQVDAWNIYCSPGPVPPGFWDYNYSKGGVEWVTAYSMFKDVLLRKS